MGISACLVEKLIRLNNFDKYKKNMNKAQKHKFDYNKNKNMLSSFSVSNMIKYVILPFTFFISCDKLIVAYKAWFAVIH